MRGREKDQAHGHGLGGNDDVQDFLVIVFCLSGSGGEQPRYKKATEFFGMDLGISIRHTAMRVN